MIQGKEKQRKLEEVAEVCIIVIIPQSPII
jgi:hypothetical protein